MIFKSQNNSYFKSPAIQYECQKLSPLLPYPRINSTKMIIHNYQNVFDANSGEEVPTSDNLLNTETPIIKNDEQVGEKEIYELKQPKLSISKSANIFTQLNETSDYNILSSLNKIAKNKISSENQSNVQEDKGFTRFSMNNVTNIYINYTFEKKKSILGVKRARKESGEDIQKINTKVFNIQDIRIMRKKIKQYFQELDEYNIEVAEPIFQNKFAILNNKKILKIKSRRNNHEDKSSETKKDESSDEDNMKSKTLMELEEDSLIIQRKICLDELKNLILSFQENYMIELDKSKCKELIIKSVYYIDEINKITDRLKKSNGVLNLVKKTKIKNKKGFQCDYCECEFSNGQALGGHMSRTHPNQSMKYNKKKMIRQEREIKRDLIYQARRELFSNHNLDYEELARTKDNKQIIRRIRKENMKEYKEILDRLKRKI